MCKFLLLLVNADLRLLHAEKFLRKGKYLEDMIHSIIPKNDFSFLKLKMNSYFTTFQILLWKVNLRESL